jgi:hypothetical protein
VGLKGCESKEQGAWGMEEIYLVALCLALGYCTLKGTGILDKILGKDQR